MEKRQRAKLKALREAAPEYIQQHNMEYQSPHFNRAHLHLPCRPEQTGAGPLPAHRPAEVRHAEP